MKLLTRSEEYVLLAVWRLQGNAYTLSILSQVSEVSGYEWQLGVIYLPLERLVRKGYLFRSRAEPTGERGGRSKFLYELTAAGQKALREIRAALFPGCLLAFPAQQNKNITKPLGLL